MGNNRVKQLEDEIQALGFTRDHSAPNVHSRVYRHAYSPSEFVKISDQMNDSTIHVVRKKAHKVAGLGTTSSTPELTEKEHKRIAVEKKRLAKEAKRAKDAQRAEAVNAKWSLRKEFAEDRATYNRLHRKLEEMQRGTQTITADSAREVLSNLLAIERIPGFKASFPPPNGGWLTDRMKVSA